MNIGSIHVLHKSKSKKKHILNYSNTREVYVEYRKAAKQAFDELGLRKIPRVKDLNEEYYSLMSEKKMGWNTNSGVSLHFCF